MEEHQSWHGFRVGKQRSVQSLRLSQRDRTAPVPWDLAFRSSPIRGAQQQGEELQQGRPEVRSGRGRAQRTWGRAGLRAGRGPFPSPPPRCALSGASGEPQTKSRGRAGTGARRGRPGGGDAAGAAARGTGEPSPGAGRRSLGLRSPGTKGSCWPRRAPWPGLPSTMSGCEPRRARALLLLALCSLSAAQPRQRQ